MTHVCVTPEIEERAREWLGENPELEPDPQAEEDLMRDLETILGARLLRELELGDA